MATATARRTSSTRKASTTRKVAPKPNYSELKFEFGEVMDLGDLLNEVDRYIEHVNERKPLASSKDKQQYWAGQGQAMKAFRAVLATFFEPEAEVEAEEASEAAA